MASYKKYIVYSVGLHIALLIACVGMSLGDKERTLPDTYMVSLVASPAAMAPGITTSQAAQDEMDKNTISPSFSEIKKEPVLGEELTSSALPYEQSDVLPDTGAGIDGGVPTDIAIWKTRVRNMVYALWEESLQNKKEKDVLFMTIYLLRISRQGELLRENRVAASGNEDFDNSAQESLARVQRFPPPPHALTRGDAWVDVQISFSHRDLIQIQIRDTG